MSTTLQQLSQAVQVNVEIECNYCEVGCAAESTTAFGAAKEFYNDGWRTDTQGYAVCCKCVAQGKDKR